MSFDNHHTSKLMATQKPLALFDNCMAQLMTADKSKVGTSCPMSIRLPQHICNISVPSKTSITGDANTILLDLSHKKMQFRKSSKLGTTI